MKDTELCAKVNSAMYALVKSKGFAAPADVLMEIGVLSKGDYDNWRFGKTDYLERSCKINLKKLTTTGKTIRKYALKQGLKASWTDYRKWGKGGNIRLRFSKSGEYNIERSYATHYVGKTKIDEAVAKKEERGGIIQQNVGLSKNGNVG
jgi:hypothetical protein